MQFCYIFYFWIHSAGPAFILNPPCKSQCAQIIPLNCRCINVGTYIVYDTFQKVWSSRTFFQINSLLYDRCKYLCQNDRDVVLWLHSTFIPASDGSVARRVGTQSVKPGSNPGCACRSVSVSLDNGGSFVQSYNHRWHICILDEKQRTFLLHI